MAVSPKNSDGSVRSPGAIRWPMETTEGVTVYVNEQVSAADGSAPALTDADDPNVTYRLVKLGVVEEIVE